MEISGSPNDPKIQDTALIPLMDLALDTDIPNTGEILSRIVAKKKWERSGKSYLAESRYKSAEQVIKEEGYKQILELGSGFTPHAVNLQEVVDLYVEVDYRRNIELKKQIVEDIFPNTKNKIIYIPGDILDDSTWLEIEKMLLNKPVGILAEGFMQYTSKKERAFLLGKIKKVLKQYGGSFFFEDSLTFHPSLRENNQPDVLTVQMSQIGDNKNLLQNISQEELTNEFIECGFGVKRIKAYSDIVAGSYNSEEARKIIDQFKYWQLKPQV